MRSRALAPVLFTLLTALPLAGAGCGGAGIGDEKSGGAVTAPAIDVVPGSLSFRVKEGEAGPITKTFTIANYGTEALQIEAFEQTGSAGFTILSGGEAGPLAPKHSQTVVVAFDPAAGAPSAGRVTIRSNDPLHPQAEVELEALEEGESGGGGDTSNPVLEEPVLDVFLLLDTAYDYSCYHGDLENFVEETVEALYGHFEGVAVGLGTYDDYVQDGWAASNGTPYRMLHAISTDHDSVVAAAQGQAMVYGGDSPSSAYEALYQATWGAGYDQTCDGDFDPTTDIQPYVADVDDAFHGAATGTYDATVEGSTSRPGVGWREGAIHIVIMSADNVLRDSLQGHAMPSGSCAEGASQALAVAAFQATDTRLLTLNVYEFQASDPSLQAQLIDLANAGGWKIDSDGDDDVDDPAVIAGNWDFPAMDTLMVAVEDLGWRQPE